MKAFYNIKNLRKRFMRSFALAAILAVAANGQFFFNSSNFTTTTTTAAKTTCSATAKTAVYTYAKEQTTGVDCKNWAAGTSLPSGTSAMNASVGDC